MTTEQATFVYKFNGRFSKQYKTYIGCYRAAQKHVPFDTIRIIYKVRNGQITAILD